MKESTQEREKKTSKGQGLRSMQANMPKEACHTQVKEPLNDETLPIINKPKHPKKGEIQGTKWKDMCLRRQTNHPRL